jgi:hypothetical protein
MPSRSGLRRQLRFQSIVEVLHDEAEAFQPSCISMWGNAALQLCATMLASPRSLAPASTSLLVFNFNEDAPSYA